MILRKSEVNLGRSPGHLGTTPHPHPPDQTDRNTGVEKEVLS